MRIGSAENLTLLLIHRDRFGEGRFHVPPAPIVEAACDVVTFSSTARVAPVCDDQPACSHPCDAINSTIEPGVPIPGGYGYPELPLNDAAASSDNAAGDPVTAVGGGAGMFGVASGGVGNLLDVFA